MRRRNGRRRQGDGADQDQRAEHADDAHQGGRQVADREVRLSDHLARDLRVTTIKVAKGDAERVKEMIGDSNFAFEEIE